MPTEATVKIGGSAGQGVQTVGRLLALAAQLGGLGLASVDDHESRVRGGHNFFLLRLADWLVHAPDREVHLLVGLDEATPRLHQAELAPGGLILLDAEGPPAGADPSRTVALPIAALAKQAGGVISANAVAAGACLKLLGAPLEIVLAAVEREFPGKGLCRLK
jgi:2-oxoglutarate ferredoxin oxidoreductase subunit alpha